MSTPFRMKGWSPFTQKVDPGKTTPDQLIMPDEKKPLPNPRVKVDPGKKGTKSGFKEFLEMFKKDDIANLKKGIKHARTYKSKSEAIKSGEKGFYKTLRKIK